MIQFKYKRIRLIPFIIFIKVLQYFIILASILTNIFDNMCKVGKTYLFAHPDIIEKNLLKIEIYLILS